MEIKERKELIRILPRPQWLCFRRADTTCSLMPVPQRPSGSSGVLAMLRCIFGALRMGVCVRAVLGSCPAGDVPRARPPSPARLCSRRQPSS